MLKKIALTLAALVLLIALAVVICFAWIRAANIPDRDRNIEDPRVLAMLDAEVRVQRDRHGVPYIYAETLADVLRVQGSSPPRTACRKCS